MNTLYMKRLLAAGRERAEKKAVEDEKILTELDEAASERAAKSFRTMRKPSIGGPLFHGHGSKKGKVWKKGQRTAPELIHKAKKAMRRRAEEAARRTTEDVYDHKKRKAYQKSLYKKGKHYSKPNDDRARSFALRDLAGGHRKMMRDFGKKNPKQFGTKSSEMSGWKTAMKGAKRLRQRAKQTEAHDRKGRLGNIQKYGVLRGVSAFVSNRPSTTASKSGLKRARKAGRIWRKFAKKKKTEQGDLMSGKVSESSRARRAHTKKMKSVPRASNRSTSSLLRGYGHTELDYAGDARRKKAKGAARASLQAAKDWRKKADKWKRQHEVEGSRSESSAARRAFTKGKAHGIRHKGVWSSAHAGPPLKKVGQTSGAKASVRQAAQAKAGRMHYQQAAPQGGPGRWSGETKKSMVKGHKFHMKLAKASRMKGESAFRSCAREEVIEAVKKSAAHRAWKRAHRDVRKGKSSGAATPSVKRLAKHHQDWKGGWGTLGVSHALDVSRGKEPGAGRKRKRSIEKRVLKTIGKPAYRILQKQRRTPRAKLP